MARTQKRTGSSATSPEMQEQRLISLAVNQTEKMLEDGTAPVSVVLHYLKLATSREALEQERLRRENLVLEAKTQSLQSAARSEELFKQALDAFTSYKSDEEDD